MSKKGDIFVREFVLGFGFLGGIFTRVGVDPETMILQGLLEVLESFLPPPMGSIKSPLLILFMVLLTVGPIYGAYRLGRGIGLLAVALAWFGGFIIVLGSINAVVGLFFLIAAIFIGGIAVD